MIFLYFWRVIARCAYAVLNGVYSCFQFLYRSFKDVTQSWISCILVVYNDVLVHRTNARILGLLFYGLMFAYWRLGLFCNFFSSCLLSLSSLSAHFVSFEVEMKFTIFSGQELKMFSLYVLLFTGEDRCCWPAPTQVWIVNVACL